MPKLGSPSASPTEEKQQILAGRRKAEHFINASHCRLHMLLHRHQHHHHCAIRALCVNVMVTLLFILKRLNPIEAEMISSHWFVL